MALRVMKFGGTSVGSVERIRSVARRVARARKEDDRLVVVVSAMGGETDRLQHLVHEVSSNPDRREMDVVLSSGERVSMALLALAIQELGCPAQSLTGRQVGILTDEDYTRARIREIRGERIRSVLDGNAVAVVAGFQGISPAEDVTTLGRGGSDLTAVALAAELKADVCEIYTDVDGVYTADPNIVPEARKLEKISYEEMLELASLGAKVLYTRSVEYAANYRVPIHVRSSFNEETGTMVTREDRTMEQVLVSGITLSKNDTKLTIEGVPDRPGIAASLFMPIAEAGISVDMIVQNVGREGTTDITFTVARSDAERSREVVGPLMKEIGAEGITADDSLAKLSIVGLGMRSHAGVAARMFKVLADEGINIHSIGTSEIKISCLIEAKYGELAMRVLHESFDLKAGATTRELDL
ncbi:aspartate kinase [Candidatus Moduliflexota bacterium]